MGVSSTRVGDHRGSARTVQFFQNLCHVGRQPEVRTSAHGGLGGKAAKCGRGGGVSGEGWQWFCLSLVGSIPTQPCEEEEFDHSSHITYSLIVSPHISAKTESG